MGVVDPEFVEGEQELEKIYKGIEEMIIRGFPKLLLLTDGTNAINVEVANRTGRGKENP